MWLLSLFIGSVILALLWFFLRTFDFSLRNALVIMPTVILANLFYWHAYRTAPSFLAARYLMSSMTHVLGWVLIIFILKEPVTIKQVLGTAMIISGIYLVK
jgi:drug/metabolite transporter (DMT)-like permease